MPTRTPLSTPQEATLCSRCGFETDRVDEAVCPLAKRRDQSLTHLGISNSIGVSDARSQRAVWPILWIAFAVLVVMIGSFLSAVRVSNRHLDEAVARIERAR